MTRPSSIERSFFKYASPKTALAILQSKAVRYNSPLKFNDPFDLQSGLHFDFNLSTLHAKILNRLKELAIATEEPAVDAQDPWGKLVLLVREKYPTYGFPLERWEQMSSPLFNRLAQYFRITQQKYKEHWQALLPNIRVFCVSEERDNLLMWAHYAKDHTGVVFEFRSLPEEDNPLSVAQPVVYVDHPVPFFTEGEWIDEILSIQRINWSELNQRYGYIKSTHWQYENEWRIWYSQTPGADSGHFDCPIRPSEFAAVYIGCQAEPKFASDVIALTHEAFPTTRIYRARKSEAAYTLEYDEISK